MPIFIADTQEPRPELFFGQPPSNKVPLAGSVIFGRLCNELERYVSGEVSGRSFLISGHRGAGKTTIVLNAVEATSRKFLGGGRPLFVPLHGPDLLPSLPEPTTNGSGRTATGKPGSAAATASDTREFLKQITLGIYRSLADLFFQAYWSVAETYASTGIPAWRDLPERAAQLRVELDGPPDLSLLREYWKRAGALPDGILLRSQTNPFTEFQPTGPRNRGMLELVALSSAAQAYKLVTGEVKAKLEDKQDSSRKSSLALQAVGEVKNLLNPVLGTLAGVAVGLGFKSAEFSGLTSAIAGAATGLGTAISLNFSSSRSSQDSHSVETTFLPDTTIASLDHTLPLLVGRCRQAGLVPVFVVDELDKVPDLAKRMSSLIHHLKYLVREKAFFCFLTDRSYLEALRRSLVETPYRSESTYFSDRILVLYQPADLHKHLSNVFQPASATADETRDLVLLPYVLLHRSRMHPFDLQRQLGRLRGADGYAAVIAGAVRTDLVYRFDVLIQVAVEWLLDQKETRTRLGQDQDFNQVVYDTLYYPSRVWEKGLPELDVSEDAFFAYLAERMSANLDEVSTSKWSRHQDDCPLSEPDKNFLYLRLQQLVRFLLDPSSLASDINENSPKRFHTDVIGSIPVDKDSRLLKVKEPDIYTWQFDVFGRPVDPPGVVKVLADFSPDEVFINGVQNALAQAVGAKTDLHRMASQFNVLSATPAWTPVRSAMNRLRNLTQRKEPYAEMASDARAVWEYAQMLRASGTALAAALIVARVLGGVTPYIPAAAQASSNPDEDKILEGLSHLTFQLGLATLPPQQTRERLLRIVADLEKISPGINFDENLFDLAEVSVDQWSTALKATLASPGALNANSGMAQNLAAKVEQAWHDRFRQFFRDGTTSFEPTAEDLVCAAANVGVSSVMPFDLNQMTISSWSFILTTTLGDPRPGEQKFPAIVGFVALVQLGFVKEVIDYINAPANLLAQAQAQSQSQIVFELQSSYAELATWIRSMEARRPPEPAKPAVVVITDYTSQITTAWTPSSKYAGIVTSSYDLPKLRQALQPIWRPNLITRLILEIPAVTSLTSSMPPPSPSTVSGFNELLATPYSYISAVGPGTPIPSGLPLTISPKTLDEAVDLAPAITPLPNKLNL